MTTVRAAIERWGGILIAPRATLEALGPDEGRYDGWWLAALFVLGSQLEHLTATVARYQAFQNVWILINGLALALLTPLFVGFMVEGFVGAARPRYRSLPLVALVVAATLANLGRQQGLSLPGPHYLPEMLGAAWAGGLALWIRKTMPVDPPRVDANTEELIETAEEQRGVTHGD